METDSKTTLLKKENTWYSVTGHEPCGHGIDCEGVTLFPDKRMKFDFGLDY